MSIHAWDHLAKQLLGQPLSAIPVSVLFAPLDETAQRVAIRYRLTEIETVELADFVRDHLDQWSAPPEPSAIGDALRRWSFRVADNRAKSVTRARARKLKVELDVPRGHDTDQSMRDHLEDSNQSVAKDVALLHLSTFIEWLRKSKGREEELMLLARRIGLEPEETAPVQRWSQLKEKAVGKRLRSLWRAYDAGENPPAARHRRSARTTAK